MAQVHIHLVSDATGETISTITHACLVQFEDLHPMEHVWSLIRTPNQMMRVINAIEANPGIVLCTLVDQDLWSMLEENCRRLDIPCLPVLDPILNTLGKFLSKKALCLPGRQHSLDTEYFSRIEAMHFVFGHDDGQSIANLEEADVVLTGVSRTAKTPTCIYLANRGIKAANVPLVPGVEPPAHLLQLDDVPVIALTKETDRLVKVRKSRLRLLRQNEDTDYVNPQAVQEEVNWARKICTRHQWPILDVSYKSIEEIASSVVSVMNHQEPQ